MNAPFRRALLALTALAAVTLVHAQAQNAGRNLNVMAVNTSNGQIYSVTFAPPGGSTTVGNTDASNYVRPEALAFVTNATTKQLDLLVADNQRGTIYRYPGALTPQTPANPTTGILVWNSNAQGSGPVAPDALAVDGYGNLFVANSTSGHSQAAQLWEFKVGSSGSGSFATPVLLDSNFQSQETLLEVTLVPTDVAGASGVAGGDLIVLTTSRVLAYSQASGYTARTTLLSFPNGSPVPGGMDFWPFGNGAGANYSLLISGNTSGTIARYYFTNPLTTAPAPFASGLGAPYKVKTLFQAGNPLLFVSENGAILEFGANADGTGSLTATVTQSVTTPQGLAVSNSFTNALSLCQQPGGCNLTGLLTHFVIGVSKPLTGNIVESVCTVNADPRVSFTGGVWSCSVPYTPAGFTCPAGTPPGGPGCLPVNAVCPGFDDTGKMVIPDSLCGNSGASGAGFSLIKTLVTPGQFNGGYVENSAVLADGSNPLCGLLGLVPPAPPPAPGMPLGPDGAFLWAPLLAEGALVESPNVVDVTSGCGSIHAGTAGSSLWGVGFSVNEAAQELTTGGLLHPLENFAWSKYSNLTNTIQTLTTNGNITGGQGGVSGQLWAGNVPPQSNGSAGCVDQSWQLYYNATKLDTDQSDQWQADLQNAANLLTTADVTTNTTCDAIVIGNLAGFTQTQNPGSPPPLTELNPSGQVRSRLANLYYSINTRLLHNPVSAAWPLPVSVNVSPTTALIPGSATLSWNTSGDSSCTLGNTQLVGAAGQLTLTAPAAPGLVQYTVSCRGPAASTVYAWVNWVQQPTLTLSAPSILQGGTATLIYNAGGNNNCTLSSPGGASTPVSGSTNVPITVSAAGTYALACPSPTAPVAPQTLAVVQEPTLTLSPATIVHGGTPATLIYNAGGSSCTLSSPDGTSIPVSGSSNVSVAVSAAGAYTLNCPSPTTPVLPVTLTVTPQLAKIAISLSPYHDADNDFDQVGDQATLSWTLNNGATGCQVSGAWPAHSVPQFLPFPVSASGSRQVTFSAAGTYTYTLACTNPSTPAQTSASIQSFAH